MASSEPLRTIREATVDDAGVIHELYGAGDIDEFTARLADRHTAPGTVHFVAESEGQVIAAFALTGLGRLRPGGRNRLLLHEIRLRLNARGTRVTEDILGWLATNLAVGTETELLALAPLGRRPSSFDRFGLTECHTVFKWPVLDKGIRI
ncbi:hypothetical protein [Streptomyces blastmyceticus]|uniref:N-acetyltransferase domain-containing protein n=1 Tax=Streptomyces blastmyceticus TaxID=68180 RepID=A0ABP3G4U4_9ACTN